MATKKKSGILNQARHLARQVNGRQPLSARNIRRLVGRLPPAVREANADLIESALRKSRGETT